jgi:CRISPR/Cas system CSM-associated protein Csm4 (group 5 of RAMP superfamily)
MEKYLIDYEIDREKEAEKEPEKGPVMDYDERKEEKSQEEKEREEKAKKAANKANYAWQAKEYEQINVKLPRGLKKAFLLACKEKGISGRQYLIDSMRKLIDEEIGHWDIP